MDSGFAPRPPPHDHNAAIRERVVEYYAVATADYRLWSRGYNMHFGYWRRGLNPLRRESLLDETNQQVPSWRWRHIVASVLTPLLGLYRSTVMYGVVTARTPR